jgi:hypothetical protein
MTITASSDDSRSIGDEFQNGEGHNSIPEDGGSCTGKILLYKKEEINLISRFNIKFE